MILFAAKVSKFKELKSLDETYRKIEIIIEMRQETLFLMTITF